MRSKKLLIIVFSILLMGIFICFYLNKYIKINLNGNDNITVEVNSTYQEQGANLIINNKKRNYLLKQKGKVNTKKIGEYIITYSYFNKKKNRVVKVIDSEEPTIKLNGNSSVMVYAGNSYTEEGYTAIDNYDGDITSKVNIINNVDYNTKGEYIITYEVIDSSKNKSTTTRKIIVKDNITNFSNYNDLDNTKLGWSISQYTNGIRPTYKDIEYYKEYNAYFLGKDEKVIYLTFDEGGNLVTYVEPIVEILNKYNIKATFFMCDNYIKNNPTIINKLVTSGHMIGNHTVNHYSMPEIVNDYDKYMYQIKTVEDSYKEITGKEMPKLFRYPSGEYSKKTLSIMKELGYKTIFWSINYDDWQQDTSKEYSYNILTSRRHNGAIYLIHPKNKGNYEALEDFIKDSIANGYTFDLVTNI